MSNKKLHTDSPQHLLNLASHENLKVLLTALGGIIPGADPSQDQYFLLKIDSNGVITVKQEGLEIPSWDYMSVSYPTATQEVYTFKSGGSGGTTVATITVDYTDSSKSDISAVTKT